MHEDSSPYDRRMAPMDSMSSDGKSDQGNEDIKYV